MQLFLTATDSNIMRIKPGRSQEGQPWQPKEGKQCPHCRTSEDETFLAPFCVTGIRNRLTALVISTFDYCQTITTFPIRWPVRLTVLDLDGTLWHTVHNHAEQNCKARVKKTKFRARYSRSIESEWYVVTISSSSKVQLCKWAQTAIVSACLLPIIS